MKVTVVGLESARRSLRRAIKDVDISSEQMLIEILLGVSAATKPYIPVDTSTLINSEERRTWNTAGGPKGYIAYGRGGGRGRSGTPVSEYYAYVHNGPQKNWKKPGASNRYLQKGVRDFVRDDLSRVIARYTQ